MIIIEGPDGAGKTTLADSLAKMLDLNILKMTANGGQSVTEYVQKLMCDGVVMDRCWISEQIYADVFGREQRLSDEECKALTKLCGIVDIPIIILLPPLHTVVERLVKRGDEFGDTITGNIELIYRRYEEFAAEHPDCILIDDNDPTKCMLEVLKCML